MIILTFLSVLGTTGSMFANVKLRIIGFVILIGSNTGWLLTINWSDMSLVWFFFAQLCIAICGIAIHARLYKQLKQERVEFS
jgi:hypothetical protein